MKKTYQIKINQGKESQTLDIPLAGAKGQAVTVKAVSGARYQLVDTTTNYGPENIRVSRQGKDMKVSFEGSNSTDLVIEDYYKVSPDGYNGLIGEAESGKFYEYIPESASGLASVPMLGDTSPVVGMALGGMEVAPAGAAVGVLAAGLFNPAWLGVGALGAAAAAGGGGGGAGGSGGVDTTAPTGQTGALSPVAGSDSGKLGDNLTNITKPTITGKAEAGSTVEVSFRDPAGKLTGPYKTKANDNGDYSIPVPDDLLDTSENTKGTQYTPVIKVTDAANNSSTKDGTPFVVDTKAAAVTVQIDADANPVGNNDGYINAAEKKSDITSLTVFLDKTKMVAGDVITLTDGTTSQSVTLTDADISAEKVVTTGWKLPGEGQELKVKATVKDLAGNLSPVSTDNAIVDTVTPNGGAAVGLTIDLDMPVDDHTINSSEKGPATTTSLTASFVSSKVNVGDIVMFSDGATTKSVTLNAADVAKGQVTSFDWLLPAEGVTMNVTAVIKDLAGNAADTATDFAKIDTTAPNGGAAVGLTIDLDSTNDGTINYSEIGSPTKAQTTTLTATFDKNLVMVGDVVIFNDAASNTTKSVTLDLPAINAGKVVSPGWTLPAEGSPLNVTAILKDAYGNPTAVALDSAQLDTLVIGEVSAGYDYFKVSSENLAYKTDPQGMWLVANKKDYPYDPYPATNTIGNFELADNSGNMNSYKVGNPTTTNYSSVGYTNLNSSGVAINLSIDMLLANQDTSLYISNTTLGVGVINLANNMTNKLNIDLLDVLNHGVNNSLNLGNHPQFKIDGDSFDQVHLTNNLKNSTGWTSHETVVDGIHNYTHYSGYALGLQVDLLIDQRITIV